MKNIALVGFMGTGKTAAARMLSGRLNMKYISTDDLIEGRVGMSIPDIFSKKGEKYFRSVEREVIKDTSTMKNVIIDTGGGALIDPNNLKDLKAGGTVICLWATPENILERTKKYAHRPLLNVDDPLKKIRDLLAERRPFYQGADHHIHTSPIALEKVVLAIERIAKE
ncbi:MAG: shikimate kinase [Candidatus Omnitrophota bacterium]